MKNNRYKMPPEWDRHAMTLLTWPDNRETWPGDRLNRAEHVYGDILEALVPHEKTIILVANNEAHQAAAAMIQNREIDWNRVRLVRIPVNDVWIRDYGPITVIREPGEENGVERSLVKGRGVAGGGEAGRDEREVVFSDWGYNAWGGKHPYYETDNAVPVKLADLLDYPLVTPGMILEGGAIDGNGSGCLLTTESVLLNPNRNPGMNKEEIGGKLRSYLGVEKIIWLKGGLKGGLKGDDTDGHIDTVSRFVSERTIVTSVSDNPDDPNFEMLRENRNILNHATDLQGRPFQIIDLPLPDTRIEGTTADGFSLVPSSYVNFYIANGCVLVPFYDRRYDDNVLGIFQSLFPERYIKGIPCHDLVWGQGSIHRVTQQVASI